MTRPYRLSAVGLAKKQAVLRRLHMDPVFAAAHAERSRERMRRLHADPEFAAANAERGRERMHRMNADPEFAAATAERGRERMRRLHADPARNPLADLTPEQRKIYSKLRSRGIAKADAIAAAKK